MRNYFGRLHKKEAKECKRRKALETISVYDNLARNICDPCYIR